MTYSHFFVSLQAKDLHMFGSEHFWIISTDTNKIPDLSLLNINEGHIVVVRPVQPNYYRSDRACGDILSDGDKTRVSTSNGLVFFVTIKQLILEKTQIVQYIYTILQQKVREKFFIIIITIIITLNFIQEFR